MSQSPDPCSVNFWINYAAEFASISEQELADKIRQAVKETVFTPPLEPDTVDAEFGIAWDGLPEPDVITESRNETQ